MIKYTLKTPVTVAGKTVSELTFRKPRTGDLMVLDKFEGENSKAIALLATLADVTLPVFKEIELADFIALSAATAHLLGESLPSTESGSM